MVNHFGTGPEKIVEQVRIIDLENAAYLPNGRCIKGMLAGKDSWRSPEGHFKGELNKPSDIFSFAVVVCRSTSERAFISLTYPSASTPCLDKSSSKPMTIYKNMNHRVHSPSRR